MPKKRSEQHLIDQEGEQLLRAKLPGHWVLRTYRPDYGLDFSLETFRTGTPKGSSTIYETLGEHIFIQLKTRSKAPLGPLTLFGRGNVEKTAEHLDRADEVAKVQTYRVQLETSEIETVERMGFGVPVLLVIADLATARCSFVCLNDYIDKILIPRFPDYKVAGTRTIHVPEYNEIGTEVGLVGLRWYAKRPKLLAAFQRFTYQYSELLHAEHEGLSWRALAELFASRIAPYDFWDDTEMCIPIAYDADGLRRFIATGQPGFFKPSLNLPEGIQGEELLRHYAKADVFELWRLLSLLPKTYEDVWREWFLPTALGFSASAPVGA